MVSKLEKSFLLAPANVTSAIACSRPDADQVVPGRFSKVGKLHGGRLSHRWRSTSNQSHAETKDP